MYISVEALSVKQNSGSAVVMSVNPFSSFQAGNNREFMAGCQYGLQLVTLRCHPVIVTQEVEDLAFSCFLSKKQPKMFHTMGLTY